MNEIKNLLAENRKALQGLHAIANMDFEKPFIILERTGKFTYNSILKDLNSGSALYSYDTRFYCKIKTTEYNIFVLYKRTDYNDNDMYIARLNDSKFEAERKTIQGYERACGWRWLDTSIGKEAFEKARKSSTGHYFIIAQEKQFENKRSREYSTNDRFKLHFERKKLKSATPYYRNSDKWYDNIISPYDRRTFDKSGYMQQVNNYEQRVRALKAERSEAAAAVWDNTEKCAEVENRIRKINARIAELTAAPVNEIPYMKIYHCYMSLSWIGNSLKALYKNDFSSMENLNHSVSYIENQLAKAESELDKEDK